MKNILKMLNGQRGNIIILVALSMVILIGLSAIVIDGGRMYSEKSNLQKAVDAAAIAGAQLLPQDSVNAGTVAEQIALANISDANVTINVEITDNNSAIRVTALSNVQFALAKVLNAADTDIKAAAKVIVFPLSSYQGRGIVPFGIDLTKYSDIDEMNQGDLVQLKWGDSESGNFGPLNIDGSGANNYRNTLINGSEREIKVGDIIDTETGNMAGPTEDLNIRFENDNWHQGEDVLTHVSNHESCPRIVLVPIYQPLEDNDRQVKQVEITGFASIFITEIRSTGNDKGVDGVYLERTYSGAGSSLQQNFGTYGYILVE